MCSKVNGSAEGLGPPASLQTHFLERHSHLETAPRARHGSPLSLLRESLCGNCLSPSS